MANENNMSCARVKTYTASKIGAIERHNERKNNDYGNVNVDPERIPMNVHFKDPGDESYMDILLSMEESGEISRRGLKADAALFDEIVFDVNTMYFETNGGYEYAKRFYQEAYRYACKKYGERNIITAVMHADEINKTATDELGYPVYHYHMHLVAMPTVKKEILWTKRCKDPKLIGTVKETVTQISHSKMWASTEPLLDENGKQVFRKNGKPKFRPSYSVLQDEFFVHMNEHGFVGFSRGKEGSGTEHLSSLEYQIRKDRERLDAIKQKTKDAEHDFMFAEEVNKKVEEIDGIGKLNRLTGNYTLSKDEYDEVTALAKEGVTGRALIADLFRSKDAYKRDADYYESCYVDLKRKYNTLKEKCKPFLDALEHFPDVARKFIETVRDLFAKRDAAEKAERERIRAEKEKEAAAKKQAALERRMKSRNRGSRER